MSTAPAFNFQEHFSRDSAVMGGETVFKGTRVLLRTILASLARGDMPEMLVGEFPTLTPEHIRAAIAFAAASHEWMRLGMRAASEDAKKRGFHRGNGGEAVVKCPVCKTGDLHYTVAGINGHIRGRCTTKVCVSWVQ